MIIQFKNRKKETKEIEDILKKKHFVLIIIYGRRRVGKTELILHSTKSFKRIYFLASEERNLERFLDVLEKRFEDAKYLKKDWEAIFQFLKNKVDVIIIDEFQNLIKENKNILSIFQVIVDRILKNSSVKLFLLGSSVSIITSKVLSYKSPLYGRRDFSIHLRPIKFHEIKYFFQTTIEEMIKIFGFADGIPYYLIKVEPPFEKWLEKEIRSEKSFIKDEVDFLMRYEFEDVSTYKLILEAIAKGNTKLGEIKEYCEFRRTDIIPYLKNLINVGMIKREVPITESIKSRFGRYYLSDNFLSFWFRFIYPNLTLIEEGIFTFRDIKDDFNTYLGYIFEKVAKEFLIYNREKFGGFTKIGRWWYKDNEIDIVGLNERKKLILACECKWKKRVNAHKIASDLVKKLEILKWYEKKRTEFLVIFGKDFKSKINEFEGRKVICIDLKDIENWIKRQSV